VILGDEPTGNLDTRSGREVMAVLQDMHSQGRTIILVTHDETIARHSRRVIRLSDGEIISDERVDNPIDARTAVHASSRAALGDSSGGEGAMA
jgi:ABC-type ATPase involved in cell division